MRVIITLACTNCKQRNYATTQEQAESPRPHGDEEVLQILQ